MLLYNLSRIKRIEKTKKFIAAKEKIAKRQEKAKQGAAKAVETKTQKLLDYIESLKIRIPKKKKEVLINHACDHYNALKSFRDPFGDFTPATKDSDEPFLLRICVNYLRHCCTDYEEELENIAGKVGVSEAYYDLRDKIFDKISEVYPWLTNECDWQREKI